MMWNTASPRRPRASSDSGDQLKTSGGARTLNKTRYRIVVMGAAEVGKTCIVSRMLDERFLLEYTATVEEMHSGQFEVNGHPVTLDILDTSGSYEFPAMRRLSIATGDAFILVYNVGNPDSFQEVDRFHREIVEEKDNDRIPVVVVGNKTDLVDESSRSLERATAETIASIDWGYGYVEVSAKDDHNITGIFRELLAQVNLQMVGPGVEEDDPMTLGSSPLTHSTPADGRKTRHFSLKGRQHQKSLGAKRNSCKVS